MSTRRSIYGVCHWPEIDELHAMTKSQAHEFFEYFMSIKHERVENLSELVHDETQIVLDYTKKSLRLLHPWCKEQARIRMYTSEQMREVYADPMLRLFAEQRPMFNLTKRASSIGTDLGIYFCECVLKRLPSLKWTQRRQKVYGRSMPLLYGLPGSHGLEPMTIGVRYLYQLAEVRKGIELPRPVRTLDRILDEVLNGT